MTNTAPAADMTGGCPVHHGRDDRKTARIAEANVTAQKGARKITSFGLSRDILRSPKVRQAGPPGSPTGDGEIENPGDISFFFLDGEEHRKRRAAVAGLFAPKTIVTRHQAVMTSTMDEIVARLQARGSAPLDELSWHMAVVVAADIIGLTDSDSTDNLASRVKAVLDSSLNRNRGLLGKALYAVQMLVRVGRFWKQDMVPAIAARRKQPKDDVISYMVKENYSKKGMIMEALSYGGAGMMTTREFIVMCAWHLFEKPALRERFLAGPEADQFAILEEILRLEPVASLVHRRAVEDIESKDGATVRKGEVVALSIRDANTDEAITGPCPFELDPDRAKRMKVVGPYMSFSDGPHRCPGAQVALHETRIFLDRLFRLPGIRMVSEPAILWSEQIQGYELRGCVVACDPA
jgi:cytochrome P450